MHSVDCILAELNSDQPQLSQDKAENSAKRNNSSLNNLVPFPEFGVDIVLHHKNGTDISFPLGLFFCTASRPLYYSFPYLLFAESDFSSGTSSSSSESEGDEVNDEEGLRLKPFFLNASRIFL